jgi:hypothetical protein
MIQSVINLGMLQSQDVLGLLNDTNLTMVTLVTAADVTGVRFSNIKTNGTQPGLLFY